MSLSPQLSSLAPHGINKRFQHLRVEYPINSGPFGHKFKVGDTRDVEKADQHYFDLWIHHKLFLTSLALYSEISAV
jgi:hypothetical protein